MRHRHGVRDVLMSTPGSGRRDGATRGAAELRLHGPVPTTWADSDVTSPYGLTARGTLWTPQGEELRLNARYRCVSRDGETKCTQGLTVR